MTSMIPVLCSSIWAVKPTGSWLYYEFVITGSGWTSNRECMKVESHILCFIEVMSATSAAKWNWNEMELNPWPLRCRCSAPATELSSQLGARHDMKLWIYGVILQLNKRRKQISRVRSTHTGDQLKVKYTFLSLLGSISSPVLLNIVRSH